jgi:hypothetical protein
LLRFALNQGGKPAGIRVAMTKEKMEELERAGEKTHNFFCTRRTWVA